VTGLHGGGAHGTVHLVSTQVLSASSAAFEAPVQVAGSALPVRQAKHFASALQAAVSLQQVPSMHVPHAFMVKMPEQSGAPPVLLDPLALAVLPVVPPPPAPVPPPAPLLVLLDAPLLLDALLLDALLLDALLLDALLLLAELEPVPIDGAKHAPIDGAEAGASHAAMLLLLLPPVPVEDEVVVVVVVVVVCDPVVSEPVVVVVGEPPALVVVDEPVESPPHARGTRGAIAATTRIQE
jgi:hypothetical protein